MQKGHFNDVAVGGAVVCRCENIFLMLLKFLLIDELLSLFDGENIFYFLVTTCGDQSRQAIMLINDGFEESSYFYCM
jgi:hypothetical protein